MRLNFRTAALFLLGMSVCPAARLSQTAGQAFEVYVKSVEARLSRQHAGPVVHTAARMQTEPELPAGAVRVEPVNGGTWPAGGGLLHHWRAAAFVPGAGRKEMLALLRDYGNLSRYYAPEVVSSRELANHGETVPVAMRFRKRHVVTVVLDAEFAVESGLPGTTRGYSFSRSTHIWQVDRAGRPDERRRAEGRDDGYLWRLNSYWNFEQVRGGLLMECEAVSLTRDVPAGLGWLIAPVIRTLPRTSLEFTLTATKNALAANAMRRQ